MKNMDNFLMEGNGTELKRNTSYAVVFGAALAVGLPLNALSLWIFLRRHNLKSPNTVYMVNLAISDLLLIISLPMRVYFYATGNWPLDDLACIWITVLFQNNIRTSSIFITLICVNRLLSVVYPLRSRHLRTSSNAWRAVTLVWVFVLVVSIPESVELSKSLTHCHEVTCFEFQCPHHLQSSYLQPVLVLTMLAVNVVCTALVSWTLHRHLHDSVMVNNKFNVMGIFVMNLIMFTLFFLPQSLTVFFDSWSSVVTPLLCLASVNCCLDPLLYYFSFDGFWKRKENVDVTPHVTVHGNKGTGDIY